MPLHAAETELHKQGKKTLKDRVNQICQRGDLVIRWKCAYCPKEHVFTIPEGSVAVLETKLDRSRPDVTVLDQRKPLAVFEVVVTHAPAAELRQKLRLAKIPIFEFKLNSEDNLPTPVVNPENPSKIHFCMSHVCNACGNYKNLNEVRIVNIQCWKCGSDYKAAVATNDWSFYGPDRFSQEEIEAARSHGVLLEERFSKTLEKRYVANTCPSCRSVHGSMFVHQLLEEKTEHVVEMPFHCVSCEMI